MASSTLTAAYLGLGSNLGDRRRTLCSALSMLHRDSVRVDFDRGIASLYETSPVGGPPGQPDFLNTCIRVFTSLTPHALWRVLRDVEDKHGRVRSEKWGPRTLDIDLLLFGDFVWKDATLSLPHLNIPERGFVLEPLAEIAGTVIHPVLEVTIAEIAALRRSCPSGDRVCRTQGPEWYASLN